LTFITHLFFACRINKRFIYLPTANDGRPRPEINNHWHRKGKENVGHTHKVLQRKATVDGKGILKGWMF